MSFFSKLFGDYSGKVIKSLDPILREIASYEKDYEALSNEDLRGLTSQFKKELGEGKTLDVLLPRAFAAVREAGRRTLGLRHFDEQMLGGIILHQGKIAEMRTGEGKTLVATLPLYLNALPGRGAHLVSVNDYLIRLHTVWMGKLYWALGLSVGCIVHDAAFVFDPAYKKKEAEQPLAGIPEVVVDVDSLRPVNRQDAYRADITYGTNNEFGFDYLRDNMAPDFERMVQPRRPFGVGAPTEASERHLNYAIVDEVDSILIDEARTPLIISAPAEESAELYYKFAKLVKTLEEGTDYNIDEKMRSATLTDDGLAKMEKVLGIQNLYAEGGLDLVRHMEASLKAETLFKRDRDYVVREGEVVIVDEFTGRLMFGRRFSEGLHQALEAKESVEIQKESRTLATVTLQNYFRLYRKLAGMTGTAVTEAEEFHKIYNLDVVAIPTHKPMIRQDEADKIYKTEEGKFQAVVKEIKAKYELGQPVLVGTVSIQKNERLDEMLRLEGVPHEILNAKNHAREAEIIAQAGKMGAVTIATNMAGRGVDIILGGNPPNLKEAEVVKNFGGLCVIGTERHESRRIDNQLRGRSGRQGDPGESQFYLSLEDDLMRIFGSGRVKGLMDSLGVPDDMPIQNRIVSRSIETAQKKVEGHNFDIRKHLVEYDDIINKHREVIYKKRRKILELHEQEISSIKYQVSSGDSILHTTEYKIQSDKDVGGREGNVRATLKDEVLSIIRKEIEDVVAFHTSQEAEWDVDEIYESCDAMFSIPLEVRLKLEDFPKEKLEAKTKLIEYLFELARKRLNERIQKVTEVMRAQNPVGAEHIQPLPTEADLFREISKQVLLQAIDALWMDHIDAMDHLRTGIGLRGYGQRDPLTEYKREAFRMFTILLSSIQRQSAYGIFKILEGRPTIQPVQQRELKMNFQGPGQNDMSKSRNIETSGSGPSQNVEISKYRDVGRNDPCPCGSGKKFKKCHGK